MAEQTKCVLAQGRRGAETGIMESGYKGQACPQSPLLDAIARDLDVTDQLTEACRSLEVVLAADRSVREERMIALG
jgi:hypothetical protein